MRACVIFNPTARGDKARRFREHLDEIAKQATLASTSSAGDGRRLAAEAVVKGFDTIVAAGGDGTLNEVLNGIGDANGFDRCRLGVLPLGTINVFAREIGIPGDLMSAWKTVVEGRVAKVDLPMVRYSAGEQPKGRYFAQLAGAGFDARAIELTDWDLKKRVGPLAYVAAGLQCMSIDRCRIAVKMEKDICEGELVLIGNGRLYGGSYPVFHEADLNDGLLDIAVFPKVNWATLARCGPDLLRERKLPDGVARRFKARSVQLSCPVRAPFQLDGELAGELPAEFMMSETKLSVFAPETKS